MIAKTNIIKILLTTCIFTFLIGWGNIVTAANVGFENGNMTAPVTGALDGNSIDIVRGIGDELAGDGTISLVFAFVPSKITLVWGGRCLHDTTNEVGITNGQGVITITGTNTYSYSGGHFGAYDNNGTWGTVSYASNSTVNMVHLEGGHDGVDVGSAKATTASSTWTTATKTFVLDFDVYANFGGGDVSVVATAYK